MLEKVQACNFDACRDQETFNIEIQNISAVLDVGSLADRRYYVPRSDYSPTLIKQSGQSPVPSAEHHTGGMRARGNFTCLVTDRAASAETLGIAFVRSLFYSVARKPRRKHPSIRRLAEQRIINSPAQAELTTKGFGRL